jgi:hypothetical protein
LTRSTVSVTWWIEANFGADRQRVMTGGEIAGNLNRAAK